MTWSNLDLALSPFLLHPFTIRLSHLPRCKLTRHVQSIYPVSLALHLHLKLRSRHQQQQQ